jgi:hypothetical protein
MTGAHCRIEQYCLYFTAGRIARVTRAMSVEVGQNVNSRILAGRAVGKLSAEGIIGIVCLRSASMCSL